MIKNKSWLRTFLRYIVPLGTICLLAFCSIVTLPTSKAATYNAAIDVNTTYQTLEGFGASTAWYTNFLVDHPHKAEIYELIFNGLGLDIIRFRNTYGNREGASFAPDEPEIVQEAARSLGHPIKVLISSWTPPSNLKVNGVLNGGTLVKVNNNFDYAGFADYWYNSINAYINKGITPDYISIQNEPDYENTGWETCIFKATEDSNYPGYGKALDAVYNRIQSLPTKPKILGPEVTGLGSNLVQNYCTNMNLSQVYGICHHLYNGGDPNNPDSFNSNLQNVARSYYPDKPLFQTEYDQGTPFTTGQLIINSLVHENVSGYFFWDLIWANEQRPLVALENPYDTNGWTTTKGYIVSDFYYVFKHFCKYTDPGYQRVAITTDNSNIKSVAFIAPDKKQLTVILLNNSSSQNSVELNLNGYPVASSAIYRTVPGGSEKFSNVGALGANNILTLPAQSIATVVISSSGSIPTPTPTATGTPTPTPTPTPTVTPTPTSETGCAVSYVIQNDWGSGATINVTIKNNGNQDINGWTLNWTFPGNQQITNLWCGDHSQSGATVTVKNLSYNSTIPANGRTVNFGFNISYSGANTPPNNFTVNGISSPTY